MSAVQEESALQFIYDTYVKLDQAEFEKNTRIANGFVNTMVDHMIGKGAAIQRPEVVKQGSSFEGLKVAAPDEFDYLLVYDYRDRSDAIKPVESRNFGNLGGPNLPGFWMLTVPDGSIAGREWVKKYTEIVPPHPRFLAPHSFRKDLQTELNEFVDWLNTKPPSQNSILVKSFSNPSIKDPALTEVITTLEDRKISIDMSIAVKLTMHDGKEKTFFAKKHDQDRGAMLWRRTSHAEETQKVLEMSSDVKYNYRIAKYLLKNVVNNSFVLKTALLHMEQEIPNRCYSSKAAFLRTMIDFLATAYEKKTLTAFFNPEYNVLGKYPDKELESKANELTRLRNRCGNDFPGLVKDLVEKAVKSTVSARLQERGISVHWE